MNEDQAKRALDLLDSASNLLHTPIAMLQPPYRSIHQEGIAPWMEEYEKLTEELESAAE